MKTRLLAAALLSAGPAVLAQAPNPAAAPNLQNARPAPTRAAAGAQPALHLEGHITSLGCGKALEFDIVVQNTSATPFREGAVLRISGKGLSQPPLNDPTVHAAVGALGGNASETIHVKASVAKVDCVAPQTFEVTLMQGMNRPAPSPFWDRDALELSTTPPTNCSATGGSRRLPHWDPRT